MFSKKDWKYILLLAGAIIALILSEVFTPKPIDWTRSYEKSDKNPYGNYILFNQLEDIFENDDINVNKITAFEAQNQGEIWADYESILYINDDFQPDDLEFNALCNWVAEGRHAFIAASSFQGIFADSFNIDMNTQYFHYDQDTLDDDEANKLESRGLSFVHPDLQEKQAFYYQQGTTRHYFETDNMVNYTLLSEDETSHAHYIRIKYGAGYFYLHSNPLVFTNYNMLLDRNHQYIAGAFSYLPKGPVIWDEYYKSGREGSTSELRYILSQSALRWAWFLGLGTLFTFVIFNIKRRQRIIPIVNHPSNTTLEFVETIGRLYYQNKDHHDLARKKISYFKEYIRQHFMLTMKHWDQEEMEALSAKSGLSQGEVSKLTNLILMIRDKQAINEQELLRLSKEIDRFKHQVAGAKASS